LRDYLDTMEPNAKGYWEKIISIYRDEFNTKISKVIFKKNQKQEVL